MKKQVSDTKNTLYRIASILVLVFILISCEQPLTSTPSQTTGNDNLSNTPTIDISTVPALPAIYQSQFINPLDTPRTYIEDTCRYLKSRWHPINSKPGTVVMVIVFHDITNSPSNDPENVSVVEFNRIMKQLKDQGFEAINTKKFLGFVERNVKIPPRSVLIIQDGTYGADNFEKHFRQYWNTWGWPVVNGWVSQPDLSEAVWVENINLEVEGWVDHQAQGVITDTRLSDDSSKTVISRELEDPLTAFAEHYAKIPYAFIWPNNGFGLRPVQAARELGYQIAFTSNPRGPIMFNWVPLADKIDADRPMYPPEGAINDPLMTLPRYSASQARSEIDTVRASGEEAAIYAEANKVTELKYYEIMCKPTYGPIPEP